MPGDLDQDGRSADQCRLKDVPYRRYVWPSTDVSQHGGTATMLASQIAGGIESLQSASADRSSGFLKINNLPSGRAGYCGFVRKDSNSCGVWVGRQPAPNLYNSAP
jgi:hypothetical protein